MQCSVLYLVEDCHCQQAVTSFSSNPESGYATVDIAHSHSADLLSFHAWYNDTAFSLVLFMHCSLGKSMQFIIIIIITKSIFR